QDLRLFTTTDRRPSFQVAAQCFNRLGGSLLRYEFSDCLPQPIMRLNEVRIALSRVTTFADRPSPVALHQSTAQLQPGACFAPRMACELRHGALEGHDR